MFNQDSASAEKGQMASTMTEGMTMDAAAPAAQTERELAVALKGLLDRDDDFRETFMILADQLPDQDLRENQTFLNPAAVYTEVINKGGSVDAAKAAENVSKMIVQMVREKSTQASK